MVKIVKITKINIVQVQWESGMIAEGSFDSCLLFFFFDKKGYESVEAILNEFKATEDSYCSTFPGFHGGSFESFQLKKIAQIL